MQEHSIDLQKNEIDVNIDSHNKILLFFILDFSWGHCRGDFVQEAQFW